MAGPLFAETESRELLDVGGGMGSIPSIFVKSIPRGEPRLHFV